MLRLSAGAHLLFCCLVVFLCAVLQRHALFADARTATVTADWRVGDPGNSESVRVGAGAVASARGGKGTGERQATPLVSLLLATDTSSRAHLFVKALEYARLQTYPNIELVVVDSALTPRVELVPPVDVASGWLRYERTPPGWRAASRRTPSAGPSVVEKFALAMEVARGSVLMMWNDHDLHLPTRVETQMRPLVTGRADATVMDARLLYEIETGAFYDTSNLLRFVFSSVAWTARAADSGCDIPDVSDGEHNFLLSCLLHRGLRVQAVSGESLVAVRHRGAWVRDLAGEVSAGRVRRVLPAPSDPTINAHLDHYRSVALLVKSGVLAPLGATEAFEGSSGGSGPRASRYVLPLDLRVPVTFLPTSSEPGPNPPHGPGQWPQLEFSAVNAARLDSDAFIRPVGPGSRHRRLQEDPCPATTARTQWFDGDACANCTVCSTSEVEESPCSAFADTVCTPISSLCNSTSWYDGAQCRVCTLCGASQAEATPCTATSDRTCVESQGRMSDLITSLMEQFNQASAQADIGVADVAQQYLDNPQLTPFFVPRFSIENVDVDLKMSIASTTASEEEKKALLIHEVRSAVANAREGFDYEPGTPLGDLDWEVVAATVEARLEALDVEFLDNTTLLVETCQTTVRQRLASDSPSMPEAELDSESRKFGVQIAPVLESLRVNSLHKLDLLTSAGELAPVAEDKVSNMDLKFKAATFVWETYDDADGNPQSKLVAA